MGEPAGDLGSATDAPGTIYASSSELYIYYKVSLEQRSPAGLAIDDLMARCQALGVSARLMRRREPAADGTETWMEIYHNVPHDFDATLDRLVLEAGASTLTGERRAEWFVPVAC